jgi:hypothetical protein
MNIYRAGGPVSFANHTLCPWCGGEGKLTTPEEEEIRCRFYTDRASWINSSKYGVLYKDKTDLDSYGQLIAYMDDLPKFQRAVELIVNSPVRGIKQWRYQPSAARLTS